MSQNERHGRESDPGYDRDASQAGAVPTTTGAANGLTR
jgi:hypothetical protein